MKKIFFREFFYPSLEFEGINFDTNWGKNIYLIAYGWALSLGGIFIGCPMILI